MSSLISLIRYGEIMPAIIMVLSRSFVVFCCLPIHELAHGFAAHLLGDETAKNRGRLTLNPFAHLNPIGTIMIFLFGIGYANPVPINPRNFKNQKLGMALTALAGPVSNLLMGWISIWLYFIVDKVFGVSTLSESIKLFFLFATQVNVMLAVFNLLPIPPLDGSKVAASILPDKMYFKYMQYERYVMIALMIMLFTGVLDRPISFLTNALLTVLSFVPAMIFN